MPLGENPTHLAHEETLKVRRVPLSASPAAWDEAAISQHITTVGLARPRVWQGRPKPMPRLPGDRLRDAILGNHLLIELEAEAWARRHWHEAVLESWPVRPHGLPDRIPIGIGETLEIGAVRHSGD